jgi:hypothetical protein
MKTNITPKWNSYDNNFCKKKLFETFSTNSESESDSSSNDSHFRSTYSNFEANAEEVAQKTKYINIFLIVFQNKLYFAFSGPDPENEGLS